MPQKKGLNLDRVVLLGRTLEEYLLFFGLNSAELAGKKILDAAAGVSSFTAEAAQRGFDVTAFDPIYGWPANELRARCQRDLDEVTAAIGEKSVYRWDFYKSPEGMRAFRSRACEQFLSHFGTHPHRYIAGELPRTPFRDRQFDLTLVSYLLFVYEAQLSYEFHFDTLRELMRITSGEIRIYPTVTFEAEPSKRLERFLNDFPSETWRFEIVPTHFEFLRGSNCYLSLRRQS